MIWKDNSVDLLLVLIQDTPSFCICNTSSTEGCITTLNCKTVAVSWTKTNYFPEIGNIGSVRGEGGGGGAGALVWLLTFQCCM